MGSRRNIIAIGIVLLLTSLVAAGCPRPARKTVRGHVFDKAGIIRAADIQRFERHLDLIEKESDLDIKFLFLKTAGAASVEQLAIDAMAEYGIGRRGREERGILFLYVMDRKRLRIEVGYGLETYLPDAFVGYLIRNQADAFFNSPNPGMGLRLLIRILQHRIREAVLQREYDPSILDGRKKLDYLSGGAGASGQVGAAPAGRGFKNDRLSAAEREQFAAADTVDGAFDNYIRWLYGGRFDPDVDLFTQDSLPVLRRFPMTQAYFDYILLLYAGKQFSVVESGDLATLIFTDDPLASPLFFKRTGGLWRIDISAEVRNQRNYVGGVYTWGLNPDSNDEYAAAFKSRTVKIRGYLRFRDGDNRQLPVKVDVQRQ